MVTTHERKIAEKYADKGIEINNNSDNSRNVLNYEIKRTVDNQDLFAEIKDEIAWLIESGALKKGTEGKLCDLIEQLKEKTIAEKINDEGESIG